MIAKILDGKKVADEVYATLKSATAKLAEKPFLAVILVGEDPASRVYVKMKEKRAIANGFGSIVKRLDVSTTEDELLALIAEMNQSDSIHGILVQLPLPKHISEDKIVAAVNPKKDVDCFNPYNIGLLSIGSPAILPCTPAGVMEILDYYDIPLEGKKVVVVGRSNIVGKPLAALLLAQNATVNICHSRTVNLAAEVKQADVLIAAVGIPEFIKGSMIKEGAVVVDVGINRVEAPETEKGYYLVGDVAYDEAREVSSWITPVPGGVGAMTIAMLLKNTLSLYKLNSGK